MASTIKLKRGSGAPTSGTLAAGEPALDLTNNKLYSSTDGTDIVTIGLVLDENAPVGTDNVLLGENALAAATTTVKNVAIGSGALQVYNNSTGGNTAVGYNALTACGGNLNTAVGYKALVNATASGFNTAVGYEVLISQTTGNFNTAIGFRAGYNTTTGVSNVLIGDTAGNWITTGGQNVLIGNDAGYDSPNQLTTGSNNILLGYKASSSSSTVSNEITLGNSNITNLRCNDTSISSLSDQRDKTNIVDSVYGLETLEKVKVRQFEWATRRGNIKDGTTDIGFIAQELQEVGDNSLLKLVMESNPEFLEAKPANLIPILVKAVQELSAKVKELEAR